MISMLGLAGWILIQFLIEINEFEQFLCMGRSAGFLFNFLSNSLIWSHICAWVDLLDFYSFF